MAKPADYTIKGRIPALALEPFGIACNTSLAKTPITGYRDLLKPES